MLSVLLLASTSGAAWAVDKPVQASQASSGPPSAPGIQLNAPALAQLGTDYKNAPDEMSWGRFWIYLRDVLASPAYVMADTQAILAANPILSDLKVKVNETGLAHTRVWSFPRSNESHAVILQTPGHTTVLPLPQSVAFREARITGAWGATPAAAPAHGHPVAAPHPAVGPRYLIIMGSDRVSSSLWFHSYKFAEGQLIEAPEVFASLPAFFTQNVSGTASFSGNDIVLSVQPPAAPKVEKAEEEQTGTVKDTISKPRKEVASAGYKVVLKFVGGKYLLAGKLPDDAPFSVALNFAQAVAMNRPDVARAWLIDPKLISIPKYLGIIGKVNPPMRLVTMTGAGSSSRYRLITSGKDDLVIEVGRILSPGRLKGQLAVRAIFVAPPDAFAQKLSGTLVVPQAAATPAASAGGAPNKAKTSQ